MKNMLLYEVCFASLPKFYFHHRKNAFSVNFCIFFPNRCGFLQEMFIYIDVCPLFADHSEFSFP